MKAQYLLLILIVIFFTSCGSDDAQPMTDSDSKAITNFSIGGIDASINESSRTITLSVPKTDLTSLVPMIEVSENAVVTPASGVAQDFTNTVVYTVIGEDGSTALYDVNVTSSIVTFTYDGKNYEIVQEKMEWIDAAAFAVARGGRLAEINDANEQRAIFSELNNASINETRTTAPDGGGASYVWIGGNDLAVEGNWIWDGDNDQVGEQFWMGLQNGSVVNDLYNNWGNEPDDFGSGQDGLGLAITDWPLGVAGQWNDVNNTNRLFFVIELD